MKKVFSSSCTRIISISTVILVTIASAGLPSTSLAAVDTNCGCKVPATNANGVSNGFFCGDTFYANGTSTFQGS